MDVVTGDELKRFMDRTERQMRDLRAAASLYRAFVATVDTAGGMVTLRAKGRGDRSVLAPVLFPWVLAVDDEVYCADVDGLPVVVGPVFRAPAAGLEVRSSLRIRVTSAGALVVETGGGTDRLVMDTVAGQLEFHNAADAAWYTDGGSTETGRVDAASGNILIDGSLTAGVNVVAGATVSGSDGTFTDDVIVADDLTVSGSAVVAQGINTPITDYHAQAGSDTGSTTSTVTYSDAMVYTLPLPAGTWTIEAIGMVDLRHSAANNADMRVSVAGTVAVATREATGGTDDFTAFRQRAIATGWSSGDATCRVQFKANDAGTITAANPAIWLRAFRTA